MFLLLSVIEGDKSFFLPPVISTYDQLQERFNSLSFKIKET